VLRPEAFSIIIASKAADMTVFEKAGPLVVHRMGAGESPGVTGLVIAQPSAATATARADAKVLRLSKADVPAGILELPSIQNRLAAIT
jgi:CRP-like cAMP-binding protein